MATDLITLAEQKKVAAEERLHRLEVELNQAKQEAMEWQQFVDKANSLAAANGTPNKTSVARPIEEAAKMAVSGKAKIQAGSLVAAAAKALLEKGPMLTRALADEVRAMGKGDKSKNLATQLGSALWRRKDLFENRGGVFHLLTQEIEFVD